MTFMTSAAVAGASLQTPCIMGEAKLDRCAEAYGAQTFVFSAFRPMKGRFAVKPFWPEIAIVGAMTAAWFLMRNIPVSHDVVWQMWIARQLLGGAKLYTDILELNPPLWFWLAVPVQKMAQLLETTPKQAIITAVFIYALVAELAVAALIAEFDPV